MYLNTRSNRECIVVDVLIAAMDLPKKMSLGRGPILLQNLDQNHETSLIHLYLSDNQIMFSELLSMLRSLVVKSIYTYYFVLLRFIMINKGAKMC